MPEQKIGDRVGRWELIEILGKGGNGEVWKVRDPDRKLAAMKILTKPKVSAFERFKAEVHIHLNAKLNHMFGPDGGGLDCLGARFSSERDCIELVFHPKVGVVLKPKLLIFESFPGFSEWAYFRLETGELAPSGVYKSVTTYEELLELEPGKYVDRTIFDQGYLGFDEDGRPIPLPKGARIVSRQFKGSYVVFAKASHYNEIDNYRGDHDRYTPDQFRDQIDRIVREYGQKIRDAEARRRSSEREPI